MAQLVVKSLTGEIFTASAAVERVRRINGERELSLSFLCNEINNEFLPDIEACWKVNFQGDWYHLFNMKEDRHGNKSFNAVLDFYFNFNQIWYMDEVENKSMTISDTIGSLFIGTDYILQIIDNFYANTMTYNKQENATQRFMYFIERHKAEFVIPIGTKIVQLRNRIGVRRSDIVIHEDDNLINLDIDTDTSSFCTAIECFYDFIKVEGSDEPQPKGDFFWRSPMVEKYGMILGEPIYDERYKNIASVSEAARLKQESTYKMSFSVDASLFDTPLNEGDEVRLIIPSKAINTYIRVVDINEKFDEEGDLVEASYTFGNENIAAQYKQLQYDAIQDINDLMLGRKKLPPSVLPKAIQQAADIVNGDTDSVMEYRKDKLVGHHNKNAGNNITLNVSGLLLNRDGKPKTAITYLGIVADAITTGTIDTNLVRIVGAKSFFYIDGDKLKAVDYDNPDRYTEITPRGAVFKGGAINIHTSSGREVVIDGYIKRSATGTPRMPGFSSAEVEVDGDWYATQSTSYSPAYTEYYIHEARYLKALLAVNRWGYNTEVDARLELVDGSKVSSFVTTEGSADGSKYNWVTFNLGEPLDYGTNVQVYYSFKVRDSSARGRLHIANRYLTDFI